MPTRQSRPELLRAISRVGEEDEAPVSALGWLIERFVRGGSASRLLRAMVTTALVILVLSALLAAVVGIWWLTSKNNLVTGVLVVAIFVAVSAAVSRVLPILIIIFLVPPDERAALARLVEAIGGSRHLSLMFVLMQQYAETRASRARQEAGSAQSRASE